MQIIEIKNPFSLPSPLHLSCMVNSLQLQIRICEWGMSLLTSYFPGLCCQGLHNMQFCMTRMLASGLQRSKSSCGECLICIQF